MNWFRKSLIWNRIFLVRGLCQRSKPLQRTESYACDSEYQNTAHLTNRCVGYVNMASQHSDKKYKETRAARPDEVNYALKQEMGRGYSRKSVTVSTLGATFDIIYGEWVQVGQSTEDSPVILCVHGAPATDGAFRPIGSQIAAQGYKILAPNFPGHGYTKYDPKGPYDFSTVHKIELIKAFMKELHIDSVTMVIGHSMGSHVAASLAADRELEGKIQAACWIGGTGVMPHRMQKQCFPGPLVSNLMYLPLIGPFFIYALSYLVYFLGFRGRTRESQVLSINEGYVMDFNRYKKDLQRLAERNVPTLVFYALDDPVVEPELIPGAMEALKIPETQIKDYDEEGQSEFEFLDSTLRRVARFVKGTHRVQFTNPRQTAQEIISLLNAMKSRL